VKRYQVELSSLRQETLVDSWTLIELEVCMEQVLLMVSEVTTMEVCTLENTLTMRAADMEDLESR